jgi:hypothetical protein
MKMEKCARCGGDVDRGACNQTYGILSVSRDSDVTGTKVERIYLCDACAEHVMNRCKYPELEKEV